MIFWAEEDVFQVRNIDGVFKVRSAAGKEFMDEVKVRANSPGIPLVDGFAGGPREHSHFHVEQAAFYVVNRGGDCGKPLRK